MERALLAAAGGAALLRSPHGDIGAGHSGVASGRGIAGIIGLGLFVARHCFAAEQRFWERSVVFNQQAEAAALEGEELLAVRPVQAWKSR